VLVGLFDFLMAFSVFIVYCLVKQVYFNNLAIIYFPLALLLSCVATFGSGCLLASLNVKYRDFRYIIPFLIQLLLFVTPVIYPPVVISNVYLKALLALNPMSAPLDLFRAAFEGGSLHLRADVLSVLSSLVLLIIGVLYFRKTEAYFADLA
jgi:lipopolysaccharide transport system permease protein